MKIGWKQQKLRDVCKLINGRAYNKPELLDEGKYPVLRVGNFFTNNHWYYSDMELDPDKYCESGDLLYAWSASFGPRMWTGDKVIYHYHIWKVLPDSELIEKKFLFMWFLWDTEQIKKDQGAGTTMIHVAKGSMEDRDILVPPLPEQQRIVGILDEAFDGLARATANAERNLRNARALFESHLQSVFTQQTKGWTEKMLGEVCEFENGDRGKNYPHRSEYVESGIPWINTGHIQQDGTLSETEMNFISRRKYESLRSGKIQPGDLVYCLRGATLGKTALVNPYTIGAVASSLVILRPSNVLDSRYLYFFLTSPIGQGLIKGYENGAAQPNLGAKSVAKYLIALPPIAEQKQLVAKLDDLREETKILQSIYQQKLAALGELKKSLLHQAFSGAL